jgi:predicted DNA-binding transcriptional regulator YafY
MRPAYDEETMEKQVVAHVDVQVSSQFFGWLAGLGKDMVLVAPEDVREQYQEYLKQILDQYRDH